MCISPLRSVKLYLFESHSSSVSIFFSIQNVHRRFLLVSIFSNESLSSFHFPLIQFLGNSFSGVLNCFKRGMSKALICYFVDHLNNFQISKYFSLFWFFVKPFSAHEPWLKYSRYIGIRMLISAGCRVLSRVGVVAIYCSL